MALRPAHETKHIPLLAYPFADRVFHLGQLNDGATNGTGLWLGAQCLSLYLAERIQVQIILHRGDVPRRSEPLALAHLGWDVLATDLPDVIHSVLLPNIARNCEELSTRLGAIQIRVLDWVVPPDRWVWDHPHWIASTSVDSEASSLLEPQHTTLTPPFDLIISSDTLYSPELVTPLLRTLQHLCRASLRSTARSPPVYLCLERRDPLLIDRALSEARDQWFFKVERVPPRRLAKAMEKGGARWEKHLWEGIEIWKLLLRE